MGGKPYPAGAKQVIELSRRLANAHRVRAALVPEAKKLQQSIKEIEEQITEDSVSYRKLIDEMDVSSPGNFGFEGRIGWLLAEMVRQIDAEQATKPPALPGDAHAELVEGLRRAYDELNCILHRCNRVSSECVGVGLKNLADECWEDAKDALKGIRACENALKVDLEADAESNV